MTTHLDLSNVRANILTCRRCEFSLHCTPQPGTIHPHSPVTFLGHYPSTASVHTGSPWAGRTGRALARELERVHIDPNVCSYLNVLSCQPSLTPDSPSPPALLSTPSNWPFEVRACRVHLRSQLQHVSGPLIVTIGEDALHALLPKARLIHARNEFVQAHARVIFPVNEVADLKRSTLTDLRESLGVLKRAKGRQGGYPHPRSCLYCGKGVEGPAQPTCHRAEHKKKWAKDQIWESPKLAIYQEELPL